MQTGAATVENSMEFPQKLNMELPFDLAIPLLELYPKNSETSIQKNPDVHQSWNTNPKEPVHPDVHRSTIYNSQVLEAA